MSTSMLELDRTTVHLTLMATVNIARHGVPGLFDPLDLSPYLDSSSIVSCLVINLQPFAISKPDHPSSTHHSLSIFLRRVSFLGSPRLSHPTSQLPYATMSLYR